jgi:hypothetical protein
MPFVDLREHFIYKKALLSADLIQMAENLSEIAKAVTNFETPRPNADAHHAHGADGLADNIDMTNRGFDAQYLNGEDKAALENQPARVAGKVLFEEPGLKTVEYGIVFKQPPLVRLWKKTLMPGETGDPNAILGTEYLILEKVYKSEMVLEPTGDLINQVLHWTAVGTVE